MEQVDMLTFYKSIRGCARDRGFREVIFSFGFGFREIVFGFGFGFGEKVFGFGFGEEVLVLVLVLEMVFERSG